MATKWDLEVDLVSLGSSGGGMVAAMVGHDLGLKTALIEKTEQLGGGMAMSGGVVWIPMNSIQKKLGMHDSKELVLRYIRSTSYGRHDEAKAEAYADYAHETMAYLEANTPLKLGREPSGEDYYRHVDGATEGRIVAADHEVMPAILEEWEKKYPLLGKVRYGPGYNKGWRFVAPSGAGRPLMGSILVGVLERGIPVLTETKALKLVQEDGRIVGVECEKGGKSFFVRGRIGVLIATGGFEHNAELNKRFLPYAGPFFPITPNCNTGDGHIMGMEVGAALALMDVTIQMGMPVALDGSAPAAGASAPGKAGAIIVNTKGKRVCDETFYAAPGKALRVTFPGRESEYSNYPLWVIADSKAVNPQTKNAPSVVSAPTLRELAQKVGINPEGLEAEVKRFNENARKGVDPDFQRHRKPAFGPFPEPSQLGPVEQGPFYASRMGMGTAGHQGGLVTNVHGQVLNVRGTPIAGLYATSNAAAYLQFGAGYSSGQSNGNSITFGYLAAKHAAAAAKAGPGTQKATSSARTAGA